MAEGEFAFIARRLRPLAAAPGALGLADDAALLDPRPGMQLVLTKDAMVAGVHFLADDPPDQIARKLLRVNLSDLAAMGAAPLGYLLALARPREIADEWLAAFCAGLAADNATFQTSLLGGDTVSTPGPLTLSLTAIGEVPAGTALLRGGARLGDDVWVSGTLGDAASGACGAAGRAGRRRARAQATWSSATGCRGRVWRWARRCGASPSAAIDISDGLLADLGHVVETSNLGAEIRADLLPLSAGCSAGRPGGGAFRRRRLRAAVHRAAVATRRDRGLGRRSSTCRSPGSARCEAAPGIRVLDATGADPADRAPAGSISEPQAPAAPGR